MPSLIVTSHLKDCEDAKDVCVWTILQEEAAAYAVREVAMSSLLHATILDQNDLGGALVNHLSNKLATPDFSALKMQTVLSEALASDETLIGCVARDLEAVRERDPACQTYLQCFLYFKGFMAIQTHRMAHALLAEGRDLVAFHLQNRSSELFGVDINPPILCSPSSRVLFFPRLADMNEMDRVMDLIDPAYRLENYRQPYEDPSYVLIPAGPGDD